MNKRIEQLREKSLTQVPRMNLERARLITEFYQSGEFEKYSTPVARAKAFKHLMKNKQIYLDKDLELIVGERGDAPWSTPTYPEICCHTSEDLNILNSREKIFFKVSEEDKNFNEKQIFPYWKGRSIRDKIMAQVDDDWKKAYSAGIFTEFMEQRAPGHTVADEKLFKNGLRDFKHRIDDALLNLDFFNDKDALEKKEELRAMKISADAVINFARRHAEYAEELASQEENEGRKRELLEIARVCRKVPKYAPETFREALQHYWFIHLGVITEYSTWDSFCPGHLDQHLYPFYQKDLKSGILTKEDAIELLQAFWVKFNNQPAPPKVGVTAEESNTYTDFCNINLGGLRADGSDGTNELSYILLDVINEMRILQPSSNVQISKKTPERFLKKALEVVKTGFGQPSLFNSDAIVQELIRQGKSITDARCGGTSGCVEAGSFGKEAYILSGYFNLVKILEVTLNNGYDPVTGELLGLQTGEISSFNSFEELLTVYENQIKHFVNIKIKGNLIIEKLWATELPSPFLSLFIDDCINKGKDYNAGGARYNTTYIQMVGTGTITDSLAALKYHVFDKKSISFSDFKKYLDSNFRGVEGEEFRKTLLNETPKYGNDNDYADDLTRRVFEMCFQAVDGRPNIKGGEHRINLLPTTVHVYFGKVVGATPDGRKANQPISEGISPVQGMDLNGPTAVLKSAAKIDHLRTGGTLLNQKFTPSFMADETGIRKIASLVRSYFKLDGHHIQFNVADAKTLKEAQKNPEKYRNLIVRVAGYSDYFINLGKELQDEIIKRTAHEGI